LLIQYRAVVGGRKRADVLRRQKFFQAAAERTDVPGVATGLAVTGTGGDVMKESARIALSYVRAKGDEEGAFRFNEFRCALGQIPPRTLAQRLGELEREGLLERRIYNTRPPRAEYLLTDQGRRLGVVVDALRRVAGEKVPG
jgi:HxlR-like helix-turn-helix/Lon protease (S16) C-terminal proteolytic domain